MNGFKVVSIAGVDCYEKDGTAYLELEAVARGLGFTHIERSGNECVRWDRVNKYLAELGAPTSGCNGFIPENIFYRLAMKAKNETAEKFQAKVADEIIPSIRKTGGYIAGQENLTDDELIAKALIVAQNKIKERDRLITEQNQAIKKLLPKEVFADAVAASNSCILIGELAKILRQNGIDTGEKRLFAYLREEGYLIRRKGTDYNMPTQRSMELGLFQIKERTINNPDGSIRITKTVLVTGKGQQYFINKFLSIYQEKACV